MCITCTVFVWYVLYSVQVHTLCQLINKSLFIHLFVCLLPRFFTLFVVIFNRFLCFTVLFCFPFYSIVASDTNSKLTYIQRHRLTEKHSALGTRRRRWRPFMKVYMEFQMLFYSLSLPFFLFIIHSHGISQIPTNH